MFLLRATVSLLALAGLVWALRGEFGEAVSVLKQGFRWDWFLLAVVVFFAALGVISWRLELVFRVQHVKVSFLQAFYLSFLSLFFSLFFPSALGGDVAKGYFAYRYSGKKLGSLTGVILDRLLGFATLVLIALAAFMFYSRNFSNPLVERLVYGALGLLIFGVLFFTSRRFAKKFRFLSFLIPSAKWRGHLTDLYHAIRGYQHHKKILAACLAISLAGQFLFLWDGYFLARSVGINISLWLFLVLMPLVAFVSMAPSLSGLGVREAGFVFFFKPFMPVSQAFALSLVYDLLFYGFSVASGLVFAFKGGLKKDMIHDLQVVEEEFEEGAYHDR